MTSHADEYGNAILVQDGVSASDFLGTVTDGFLVIAGETQVAAYFARDGFLDPAYVAKKLRLRHLAVEAWAQYARLIARATGREAG